MKLPHIDLEELKRWKEENFKERLAFIDQYAAWVRKTSNGQWSAQQKKTVER